MAAIHTLADAVARIKAGNPVLISLTSNQADGVVGYAAGAAGYQEGLVHDGIRGPGKVRGSMGYLFSDRMKADPPSGAFLAQPFDIKKQDNLNLELADVGGHIRGHFNLLTWHSEFTVDFQARDGVLVGKGPAIGNSVTEAVFIVSFVDQGQPDL